MADLRLSGLIGTNPLGLFAALGAVDVAYRSGAAVRLRWTEDIEPEAVLDGVLDVDTLVDLIDGDRAAWLESPVLAWGPAGPPLVDTKPSPSELRAWTAAALASGDRCHADLLGALVAEGAVAGKGEAKPSHFHFTAGQQRFLFMVRELASAVAIQDLRAALVGPWPRDSDLPVLGWEAGGGRGYALGAIDPSSEKRRGTPGADWLAFLGLSYFPVVSIRGRLLTTGCAPAWKQGGWFRWPLWTGFLAPDTIRSVLSDESLWSMGEQLLRLRGVARLMQSPIRRTDQGGYGSFGAATEMLPDLPDRERGSGSRRRQPTRTPSRGTGAGRRS
ncbi:hypothetical protein BH24ACT9_BH24ACT9_11900 [soil metagenome]